ncbi:hypothetical protein RHGRI_023603 [Rhododendron griersonianum]|uniref:Uncharacterized protein n=1 Tax=Rhododendron griersonianum TaxID=479676 RepID=A0AAV6J681_9ERIC|nr:hypothetical protein RHGRI_023603 [Rhododendron griersonianum]
MAAKNSSFKTADIDEKSIRREKPEELVMALAEAKADAIISKLKITSHVEDDAYSTLLITADTVCFHFIISFCFLVLLFIIIFSPKRKGLVGRNDHLTIGYLRSRSHMFADYSGGHVTVVGSVLVTNLVTGTRKGEWDRAEVLFPICILRERCY